MKFKELGKQVNPRVVGLTVVLILFALLFNSHWNGYFKFLSYDYVLNMLNRNIIGLYLTCSTTLLIIIGKFDFTMVSTISFAGTALSLYLSMGIPPAIAIVLMFCTAALVGCINAVMAYELSIPSFISTMGFSTVLGGVTQVVRMRVTRFDAIPLLTWLGTYEIAGRLPVRLVLTVVVIIIYIFAVSFTRLGRSIQMIGGNPIAARNSGMNIRGVNYFLYINSAVLAAIIALLQMGLTGSNVSMGSRFGTFSGVMYALIGGASLYGGSGSLAGSTLALLIVTVINTGLSYVGILQSWQGVLSEVLVLIIYAICNLNVIGAIFSRIVKSFSAAKNRPIKK